MAFLLSASCKPFQEHFGSRSVPHLEELARIYTNLSLWQFCVSQVTAYNITSEGMLKPQHIFCSYSRFVIGGTLIALRRTTFTGPVGQDCIFSA